jgi:hypothetical protein
MGQAPSQDLVQTAAWSCDPAAQAVTVPAWVHALTADSFWGADRLESVEFEPGSILTEFWVGAFAACPLLKSIRIPAAVQKITVCIGRRAVGVTPRSLETITFESGSQLREIVGLAFVGCYSLKSICLPASLEVMDGSSLAKCGLRKVEIETGNRFFDIMGDFVTDPQHLSLVRYFGEEFELGIADEIEAIGSWCFAYCLLLGEVTFGPSSKLRVISVGAFASCENLRSISIPSFVTELQ